MPIKAILTGATGMVGEGVLLECLNSSEIEAILAITRRPLSLSHPKLQQAFAADFLELTALEVQLTGYDACFFCLGTTSIGKSGDEYKRVTYGLTMHFAEMLQRLNPEMVFCYISGAGTDSSEKGRIGWARIKGATENALLRLFKRSYMFRPGFLKPVAGQKNVNRYYQFVLWLYPMGRALYPKGFCTLGELARAMIHVVLRDEDKRVLEVEDIVALGKSQS